MAETSDDDEDDVSTVPLDRVFDALADRRRRYVLYYLRRRERKVDLTRLARHVLAWERDLDADSVPAEQHQRTYLDLYHNHIPLLQDAGIVEYCRDEGWVTLETTDEYLDACLERAGEAEGVPAGGSSD